MRLDPERVTETISSLCLRIESRFPSSGLSKICRELHQCSLDVSEEIRKMSQPNWYFRAIIGVVVLLALFSMGWGIITVVRAWKLDASGGNVFDLIQTLEATLSGLLIAGGAALLLFSVEHRIHRQRVSKIVNRLRGIAHIIDMHQLTKDPEPMLSGLPLTPESPPRIADPALLGRYLTYSSEMLSLTGKLGYLCVQDYHDEEASETVNNLEELILGMSHKIWQKVSLVEKRDRSAILSLTPS
jgi:hypothetical protein